MVESESTSRISRGSFELLVIPKSCLFFVLSAGYGIVGGDFSLMGGAPMGDKNRKLLHRVSPTTIDRLLQEHHIRFTRGNFSCKTDTCFEGQHNGDMVCKTVGYCSFDRDAEQSLSRAA
jgi:hypothetical protein